MGRAWIGVGGRWMTVGAVSIAVTVVAAAAALADGGRVAASSAGAAMPAASSFVSGYPLSDPTELDRYSLTSGQSLGRLVRIPQLRSRAVGSAVSTPHLLADGDYLLTLDHGETCRSGPS